MKKFVSPAFLCVAVLSAILIIFRKQIVPKNKAAYDQNNFNFVFTPEENAAIDRWGAQTTMEDLGRAALDNDPAALWQEGACMLTGHGWPIDTELANVEFAKSASYGFAPALYHIYEMYVNEEKNPYLACIYLNLTISRGHPELVGLYDKLRAHIIEKQGMKIAQEIEKITIHKTALISKFINKNNRNILSDHSIVDEDVLFDMGFWQEIWSGRLITGNLESWLNSSDVYVRKIELLAQKTQFMIDRIASYSVD